MADALFDGKRFRALTIVDNYSRECLEIEVGQSLKGEDVVRVMQRMQLLRGSLPDRIKVDNGSEFISKALDKWAYENQNEDGSWGQTECEWNTFLTVHALKNKGLL